MSFRRVCRGQAIHARLCPLFDVPWLFVGVLPHLVARQQSVDALCLVECLIRKEADVRREFEIYRSSDLSPDELFVAVQRSHNGLNVFAAQGHDVDAGEPKIRGHSDLGNGDDVSAKDVVVDLTARKQLGERMPDQLPDAKLPLGGSGTFLIAAADHDLLAIATGAGPVGPAPRCRFKS
jgi:hypothetical protein